MLRNETAPISRTGSHRTPALLSGEGSRIIPSSHELLFMVSQRPAGVKQKDAVLDAACAVSDAACRHCRAFGAGGALRMKVAGTQKAPPLPCIRRRRGAPSIRARALSRKNHNIRQKQRPARCSAQQQFRQKTKLVDGLTRPRGRAIRRCAPPARPPPDS